MITQKRLKELFEYVEGKFVHKTTGKIRNTPITKQHRYHRMVVDGKAYAVHRMVFLYHNGYLPKVIDHIDNDRTNNKIENLREATQQQNCLNRVVHSTSRSGHKNVHWGANIKKWVVQLTTNRGRRTIGYYDDLELAAFVAQEAREKYHCEFARG